jgi:hypothetical protein
MAKFQPDDVKTVDQGTVEDDAATFPFIQYNTGNPQFKQAGGMAWMGGWFIPENNVYENLSKREGWSAIDWVRNTGETPGFWRRDLDVAVICWRKRWEVWQSRGPRASFAWNNYNEAVEFGKGNNSRPSGRLQVLGLIKSIEDLGPFMITLRGYAALSFEGSARQSGAMNMFKNIVVAAANTANRAADIESRWPRYAFWMPVGPDRDLTKKDRPPVFTRVGSGQNTSSVALIKLLGVPDKPQDVNLDEYYVGAELLKQAEQIAQQTVEWVQAWDSIGANLTDNGSAADDESLPDEAVVSAAELEQSEIAF